jgi:hypothetical protein
MNLTPLLILIAILCATAAQASSSQSGQKSHGRIIVVQPGATPAEIYAAYELSATLREITGFSWPVRKEAKTAPANAIIIGPGPLVETYFPKVKLAGYGTEQTALHTKGGRVLLAGGRPRGTLYAVYHFLQDECGVRWWTSWAKTVPHNPALKVGKLSSDAKPAFESRDPFWFHAFDGPWAARNFSNSKSAALTEKTGGKVEYKGFVHTFYPLVPPEEYFEKHPEWYSLIDGKRTVDRAQLCTTNPELRDFIVRRVREWLKESPEAKIVSVSQNDWYRPCECPNCKAIDDREGTHAGTMLALANYVADKIGPEFPGVAIDTLAYQYTRKAPKTIKPRSNVIVRLCSIECSFAAPLEDPSNKSFADDLVAWSKLSSRLYIWDYVTNFSNYVQPHPNWFVLGPNVRFFHQHGVRGLFEQGAYQSNGAEMAEMRAWVLARLLWNPYQDEKKLIDEFLDGYYGKPSARYIREYMALVSQAAKGVKMGINAPPSSPYLNIATLSKAERLWQQAEKAAQDSPDLLWRVKQGHLPVRYVWLTRWRELRFDALRGGFGWPLPHSRKAVAAQFLADATGPGPKGWSPMTHLSEDGLTPQVFVARFAVDEPDPDYAKLPDR